MTNATSGLAGDDIGAKPSPGPKAKKPKPAKKATAKTPGKPAAANGKPGRGMAAVPAADRRVALVRLLKKLGATSAAAARPISTLAEKLRYNPYDVYCLGYHKFPLAARGMLKTTKHEGDKTVSFYLTAKGAKAADDEVR